MDWNKVRQNVSNNSSSNAGTETASKWDQRRADVNYAQTQGYSSLGDFYKANDLLKINNNVYGGVNESYQARINSKPATVNKKDEYINYDVNAANKKIKELQAQADVLKDPAAAVKSGFRNRTETMKKLGELNNEIKALQNNIGKHDLYTKQLEYETKYAGKSAPVNTNIKGAVNEIQRLLGDQEYDDLYAYINNVDGYHDFVKNNAEGYNESGYHIYDNMTDSEKGVYNYIYAKEGKAAADKYIQTIESDLTERQVNKVTDKIESFTTLHPLAAGAAGLLDFGVNWISNLYGDVQAEISSAKGETAPFDVNKNFEGAIYSEALSGAVTQRISDKTSVELMGQNVCAQLYSIAESATESGIGAVAFGPAVSVLMGASAGGSAYREAVKRGASDNEALNYARLCAIAEMAFEEISLDKIVDINAAHTGKQLIVNLLKSAGIEGSEEVVTTLFNIAVSAQALEGKSDFDIAVQSYMTDGKNTREQAEALARTDTIYGLIWDFIGGAVSGGFMSLGFAAKNQIVKNRDAFGRKIDTAKVAEDLKAQAATNGETLSDEDATKMAENVAKTASGKVVSEKADQQIRESKAAQQEFKNLSFTDYKTGEFSKEAYENAANGIVKEDFTKVINESDKFTDAEREIMVKDYDGKTDPNKYVQGFKTIESFSEQAYFSLEEAKKLGATYGLSEYQSERAYTLGTGKQQLKVNKYNEKISSGKIAKNPNAGKVTLADGLTYKDIVKNLPKAAADKLGKLGHSKASVKSINATLDMLRSLADLTQLNIVITQSTAIDSTDENGKSAKIFSGQSGAYAISSVESTDGFTYDAGSGTIYVDLNAGLYYLSELQGTEAEKAAGQVFTSTMAQSFGHEFTHFSRYWNESGYQTLRDLVRDTMGFETFNNAVEHQQNLLLKIDQNQNLSEEELYDRAQEEVVAQAMTDMFLDKETMIQLASKLQAKDQTLFEKLCTTLDKFIKKLETALKKIVAQRGKVPEAYAVQTEIDGMLQYSKELREAFTDMAADAVLEYQKNQAKADAKTIDAINTLNDAGITFEEGGTKLQIRQWDEEGRKALLDFYKNSFDSNQLKAVNNNSPTTDPDIRFQVRTDSAPKKTQKAYKLMRLENGKLYPLFIGNTEEIKVGTWYDAESPDLSQLKNLPAGTWLLDMSTGEAISWENYKRDHKVSRSKPNKDDIHWATENGYRFMEIVDKAGEKGEANARKRYGDTRAYYNWGLNGSKKSENGEGDASMYALRPGWHFGEIPSMRQIGYQGDSGEKDMRLDNQVWVEVEMSADIDYNEEAASNPTGDIPTHIPVNGYYKYATNPNVKSAADNVKADWYVAGAFKPVRIISDAEANQIVNDYNKATGKNVPLDFRRKGNRMFNAETMELEDVNPDIRYMARDRLYNQLDKWDHKTTGFSFNFGKPSDALAQADIPNKEIRLDASNLIRTLNKHKDISIETIKGVFGLLEDPVIVIDSKQNSDSRIVMGDLKSTNGKTVSVVLLLTPKSTKGNELNIIKISSTEGRGHIDSLFIKDDGSLIKIRYADKKRIQTWLNVNRVQSPLRSSILNSIDSIYQNKENVKLQQRDQEYMDAVKAGDTAKAEKMVEEAARKAGYIRKVYHGTGNGHFNVFKERPSGIYTSDDSDVAGTYGSTVMNLYGKKGLKELTIDAHFNMFTAIPEENIPLDFSQYPLIQKGEGGYSVEDICTVAHREGYDVVIVDDVFDPFEYHSKLEGDGIASDIIYFDNSMLKSADSVVYDDQGNVVPLSERFNPANEDIRYQDREAPMPSDIDLLIDAAENLESNEYGFSQAEKNALGVISDRLNRLKALRNKRSELYAQLYDGTEKTKMQEHDLRASIGAYTSQINSQEDYIMSLAKGNKSAGKDILKETIKNAASTAAANQKAVDQAKLDKAVLEEKWKNAALLSAVRKARDQKIAQIKERNGQRWDKYKDRQSSKKYKASIKKTWTKLADAMQKNSDKEHIPAILVDTIDKLLNSVYFTSQRQLNGGEETISDQKFAKRMRDLAQVITDQRAAQEKADNKNGEGVTADGGIGAYLDLPDGFGEEFQALVKRISDITDTYGTTNVINMMNSEDLRQLDLALKIVAKSVSQINRQLASGRNGMISDLVNKTTEKLARYGSIGKQNWIAKKIDHLIDWNQVLPVFAFDRFGEGGKEIFSGIQDGWDQLAWNVKAIKDFKDSYKNWDKQADAWGKQTVNFKTENGETMTMTVAQAMSLYALTKREQAVGHMMGEGVRIADFKEAGKLGLKGFETWVTNAHKYQLTWNDIQNITQKEAGKGGILTKEQKDMADDLEKFMTKQGQKWGNAISMARFGYNAFTEDVYFPINVDQNSLAFFDPEQQEASLYRLLNMSFTKSLTPKANNALVISDIYDVFANHMSDMAKYNALALPILDAVKWLNYRNKDSGVNLQEAIETAFGSEAKTYLRYFMKDLNGVNEAGRRSGWSGKLAGSYKAAAVGANLRVALLQHTSYWRAMNVLKVSDLLSAAISVENMSNVVSRKLSQEMQDNAGIGYWKSLGYYDTNIGRNIREELHGGEDKIQTAIEWSMKGAEIGDDRTWGTLWYACKIEQARETGLTGDDLIKATAKRFREVIYRTQVVDSTMTRSQLMRSNSDINKMLTSFMSEPTLAFNILQEAVSNYMLDGRELGDKSAAWQKNKGKIVRALGTYAATAAAACLWETIIDALRSAISGRPEDDEPLLDKILNALLGDADKDGKRDIKAIMSGNLFQDFDILSKLPYIRDVMSILQGYGVDRMDISGVETAISSLQELEKFIKGSSSKSTYGSLYTIFKGVSQLSGLPVSNTMRDFVMIWNTLIGSLVPEWKIYSKPAKKSKK